MSANRCPSRIPLAALIDYWFDEQGECTLEEHVLACSHCTARLEWLARLAEAIPDIVVRGDAMVVLTGSVLQRLHEHGLRIREYRVEPGGSVNCTIAPTDDLVVSRLAAPLEAVARLDLIASSKGGFSRRREDISFDRASGEIVVVPNARDLRSLGYETRVTRLVAVDAGGEETVLGEYTFNHAPFPGRS